VGDAWASQSIDRRPTPHYAHGREGRRPDVVVVHTTAGTYDGTIDWFSRHESGVSAHYLVALDGRVAQFVEETDTARHAGRVLRPTARLVAERTDNPNLYTVGVEFEDGGDPTGAARPEAQYDAGAWLIAAIAARWEIPLDRDHIVGHGELFAAKDCPGNLDVDRLVAQASGSPAVSGPEA